jgi:P27 family predicted phage terminase small subunit
MQHRGRRNSYDKMAIGPELVASRPNPVEPAPEHLSGAMKTWWAQVLGELELAPHKLHLLRLAAESYDRGQNAREQIGREGTTVEDAKGVSRANPLIAVERDARTSFARLVRELNLDAPVRPEPNSIGYQLPAAKPWARP